MMECFVILVIAVGLAYKAGHIRGGIKADIAAQKRIMKWQAEQKQEVH